MLVCLMVLALAQEPALQLDERAAVRQWLTEQFQEFDQLIVEYEKDLQRMSTPPEPTLGLRLEVVDQGGQPPRRATMVTGILPRSSAAASGVREGDRIAAIGGEELDHEKGVAFLLYLSNHPNEVLLDIERGAVRRQVTLRRTVIPCLADARRKFEAAKWHERFERLRKMLAGHAAHLPKLETQEGFELAHANLKAGSALGSKMLDDIALERGLAMTIACVPASTP